MIDHLTFIHEAFPRTVRLVSTARLRQPVLELLVDEDETDLLAEIEGATSQRLIAEAYGMPRLAAGELVHGVPHAHFINASFVYTKPRAPNRFNGPDRGAWYAALAVETSIIEVAFHIGEELSNVGDFNATIEYAEMFADFIGEFLDLRPHPDERSLSPDKSIGYPAGNLLADEARDRGLNGIVYPSVRSPGGTCFAILFPHAVQNVRQGDVWRLSWRGEPAYTTTRVSQS